MTAGQHIDYDALALEALRGVVKACLNQVASTGLLGDHHFYIAFNTQAPGVGMSKRLREKYPVEMTIVLQHRFWDLAVSDDRFEVKLTFDGIPEKLVVPFKAIKVFYDPSVPYGLQFEENEAARSGALRPVGFDQDSPALGDKLADADREDAEGGQDRSASPQNVRRRPTRRATRGERGLEAVPERPTVEAAPASAEKAAGLERNGPSAKPVTAPVPAPVKPAVVAAVAKADAAAEKPADDEKAKPESGAKIFDLSQFRNKK